MKKNSIFLVFVTILILCLGLLYYFNQEEDTKNNSAFREDRIIKTLNPTQKSIEFKFTPLFLDLKKNRLSVLNHDSQRVVFFDNNGSIIDSLGVGKGESPLESNRIYHYDYDKDYFYFFDVANYSFTKSDKKTEELIYHHRDTLRINHAQRINNDKFLITFRDSKTNISFGTLSLDNGKVKSLPKIGDEFDKLRNSWWIFDGQFDKNENTNEVFYITYFSNDLIKLNESGKLVYKKKLIHNTPLIKLEETGGMLIPSENTFESVLDSAIDSEFIYILSNISDSSREENKGKRVIDAYSLKKGNYSHSYILPNLGEGNYPIEIESFAGEFYVMYEESIKVYEY